MPEVCPTFEPVNGANPAQTMPLTSQIVPECKNGGVTGSGVGTGGGGIFDVNKILAAVNDYMAINAVINQTLGYDFKWFRAVPQQRSKDVIFQEYTLYNVDECPLDIKAVIPQGAVPDSKYTFDLMGLEYDIPFEIQIDKKYWEKIAGFGTAPQKKDIVYFPMANKLYQVESTYLYRGFMEQETAWKINLRKYMPEVARREPGALKDTIDIYTVSTEEIFGGAIKADIEKLTDDKQMSQFNGTTQDKYKKFDTQLQTVAQSLQIYGTVVAQSYYDMQTPLWFDAITYNGSDIINKTSDRSIVAWMSPHTIPSLHKEYNVTQIIDIRDVDNYHIIYDPSTFDPSTGAAIDRLLFGTANYMIKLDNASITSLSVQLDDTVVISRPGALNFYGRVVAISVNPLTYHLAINPLVLEDIETIKSDWDKQKGYKLMVKSPISILDGANDFGDHVMSVNIFANQYIAINYGHTYSNDNAYVVKLDDKLIDNEWYGIVVNIGNTWGQYNVCVWKKHDTDKNAKLQNIFYETLKLYPEYVSVDSYTINKSPAFLTNIRLFSATIEEEKQGTELLSYFSHDADQAIILDNADTIMRLPYVTKAR